MTWQEPDKKNSKRTAAFGIGGLFALLASCGIGAAIGGDDTDAAAPATTTVTDVSTRTVTTTETPTTTSTEVVTTEETTEPVETETPEPTTPVQLIPRTTEEAVPTTADGGSAYYANCSEARAAGAAPLYVGTPGYSSDLDRDGDGVACE